MFIRSPLDLFIDVWQFYEFSVFFFIPPETLVLNGFLLLHPVPWLCDLHIFFKCSDHGWLHFIGCPDGLRRCWSVCLGFPYIITLMPSLSVWCKSRKATDCFFFPLLRI